MEFKIWYVVEPKNKILPRQKYTLRGKLHLEIQIKLLQLSLKASQTLGRTNSDSKSEFHRLQTSNYSKITRNSCRRPLFQTLQAFFHVVKAVLKSSHFENRISLNSQKSLGIQLAQNTNPS